jgi:nitroreductase
MEFADVVRKRRMVRDYDPDRPVPAEVRERLLEHAIRAPSAGFSQGWAFLVLENPEERERFWTATTDGGTPDGWLIRMRRAPLLIVPMSDKSAYLERYAEPDKGWTDRDESRWPVPYWDVDAGMAALLMLLTAVDEGLGGFFFWLVPSAADGFDGDKVAAHQAAFRAEFDVPSDYDPVGAVAIGHRPDDLPPQNPQTADRRRGLDVVVHRGQWDRH